MDMLVWAVEPLPLAKAAEAGTSVATAAAATTTAARGRSRVRSFMYSPESTRGAAPAAPVARI